MDIRSLSSQSLSECIFNTIYSVHPDIFLTDRPVLWLWNGLHETLMLIQRSKAFFGGVVCIA